jgi:predicted RND superfamily exporter protein
MIKRIPDYVPALVMFAGVVAVLVAAGAILEWLNEGATVMRRPAAALLLGVGLAVSTSGPAHADPNQD